MVSTSLSRPEKCEPTISLERTRRSIEGAINIGERNKSETLLLRRSRPPLPGIVFRQVRTEVIVDRREDIETGAVCQFLQIVQADG